MQSHNLLNPPSVWDSNSNVNFDKRAKCVVVGNDSVGKTSLLTAFTTGYLPLGYSATIFDQFSANVPIDDQIVHLDIYDTAGHDSFSDLRALSYANTDVFIVCFSVVDPESFKSVGEVWIPELRFHSPHSEIVLVATKIDVRESAQDPVVTKKQGLKLAKELKVAKYVEFSSLNYDGVREVFDEVAHVALDPKSPKSKNVDCCMCAVI